MLETRALLWLLLLLPGVAIEWFRYRRNARRAIPLNVDYRASEIGWTWRTATRWIVPSLRWLALLALTLALVAPFDWESSQLSATEGIAIELVMDRSGSMLRDDYQRNGDRISRLQAVREAAIRFVVGEGSHDRRRQDSIGLVSFAGRVDVECPLTLDHEQLVARMEQLQAANDYRQDGTAIGDGLGVAVAELQSLSESLRASAGGKNAGDDLLSRVAILLTDGQHNAGELTPERAAALARHYDIRVYTIGLRPAGVAGDVAEARLDDERKRLREIAESTGGRFFTVSDMQSLRQVYDSIDQLERGLLPERRVGAKRYWSIESFQIGPFAVPPLAMITLLALALATLLNSTVYAEVP